MRALAASCHPVPTAAVTLVAVLLAAGTGLGAGTVALTGLVVLAGQLSIGWSNDRIDAARDTAAQRTDKPAATGAVPLRTLSVAAGTALVVAVASSFSLGWRAALAALVIVAAGWTYNLGLKATPLSALTYVVGFAALPAVAYLSSPGHPSPPWWAPVTAALLGFGVHIANVLPDLGVDAAAGVRGLPHRLGARTSIVVMALALATASGVVVLAPDGGRPGWSWVVGGAAVAAAGGSALLGARRPDSKLAFYGSLAVALADVLLFVLAV